MEKRVLPLILIFIPLVVIQFTDTTVLVSLVQFPYSVENSQHNLSKCIQQGVVPGHLFFALIQTPIRPSKTNDQLTSASVAGSTIAIALLLLLSVAIGIAAFLKVSRLNKEIKDKDLLLSNKQRSALNNNGAVGQQHEKMMAEATIKLEQANKTLQKANEELASFSYSISHDLKAPLRAINGFTGILIDEHFEKLDENGRRALQIIKQNANRMDQLINDLLQIAQVANWTIQKRDINMREMVESIVNVKNLRPGTVLNIAPLGKAYADPVLIKLVWENLIANAIKFSSKTEASEIQIGYKESSGEQQYWVRDNGVGFDPQYKDKLFKVFSRLHAKKEFEGTGAGLAIAQKIIVAHGGKIWAESELSKGATFYFTLPVKSENPVSNRVAVS